MTPVRHRYEVVTLICASMLVSSLSGSSVSFASPVATTVTSDGEARSEQTTTDATTEEHAALDEQLKEALKQELKREILAELEAERAAESKGHAVNNEATAYKPGDGLHLESADGDFALTTRLRAQIRQQLMAARGDEGAELSQVFELRRARLQFKGHTFGKHNKYKVELAFSPRDLGVKDGVPHNTPLLSWYVELDHLRDLTLRAGQYKVPFSRQRVISSGDLQLVDRSLANDEFNHDRDIGLDLRSKDLGGLGGTLRYYAGVYMGEGRDFGGKNATADFKLHYVGRIEILPMGGFDDYAEADLERSPDPKLSLGAAYAFHHEAQHLRGVLGDMPEDGGTTNYHSVTADYLFKLRGFSTSGEFHWRRGRRLPGEATPADESAVAPLPMVAPRNGFGWFVQAGYVFPGTSIEVAARYSGIRGLGEADPGNLADTRGYTSMTRSDSVGGGISYYFAGHPWKLQADYFNTWTDGDMSRGSNTFRLQLQLAL